MSVVVRSTVEHKLKSMVQVSSDMANRVAILVNKPILCPAEAYPLN